MPIVPSRQLLGRPVVSIAEGVRLGTIRDILVNPPTGRVLGFVVQTDARERDTLVVPTEDVSAVGPDAITVQDRSRLRPLASLPELMTTVAQQMPIKGKAVFTREGKHLGQIDDFTLDTQGFTVDAYLVSAPGLGRLVSVGPRRIPGDWVVSSGPDAIVVRGEEQPRSA